MAETVMVALVTVCGMWSLFSLFGAAWPSLRDAARDLAVIAARGGSESMFIVAKTRVNLASYRFVAVAINAFVGLLLAFIVLETDQPTSAAGRIGIGLWVISQLAVSLEAWTALKERREVRHEHPPATQDEV